MAVDAAVSRTDRERFGVVARLAAIPAWVWLAGIMAASFGGRLIAAAGRVAPYYLPDEYIYPSLARSIAEHGRPLIRGAGVHFPALLEPIVTAPVWLVTDDPITAYRLTQGLHAIFISLAVIPAYLLCKKLALPRWASLTVAAFAVAVPDAVYASGMLSDPLAYPLVLTAVYAGVCAVVSATPRAQVAFATFSALAVLARIQYAVVPAAVIGAELIADRGRVVTSLRRLWLALLLLVVPPVVLFATFGSERVLGVYSDGKHSLQAAALAQWIGREAMLLAYASGWVLVPGAIAGLAVALIRPRTRAEVAFAATTLLLAGALLLEAAQIAVTDSHRFQERYLFTLMPLLAAAFALYVRRGLPGRIPVALGAAALLLLAARIPLSGYVAAHNKDDSPTLWGVMEIEKLTSVGSGSLAVALLAAVLSTIAALVAFRKLPGAVAIVAAIAACCALSAGAGSLDTYGSNNMRDSLPHDLRWVDHAKLGSVDLLAPPGARRDQSWEQLFWNTSVERLLLLGAPRIDHFDTKRAAVSRDGTLLVDGHANARPLLVQTYGSTVQLTGVRRVRRELAWDLYRPTGRTRVRLIAAGRFVDHWLAPEGAITVWTKHAATLELLLSLPRHTQTTRLRFTADGVKRFVRVQPRGRAALRFHVPGGGPWTLRFKSSKPGYLGDRAVSVMAPRVALSKSQAAARAKPARP
ncbi:MAG: ArnT family glycosyltransferase [Gaiellaceae bacterium]